MLVFNYENIHKNSNYIIRTGLMRYVGFILMALAILVVFAVLTYFFLGEEIKGAKTFTDHLYFSTVTLASVGYGDMVPQTQRARMLVTA